MGIGDCVGVRRRSPAIAGILQRTRRRRRLPYRRRRMTDSLTLALNLVAHADAELLRIVLLSLRVSGSACLFGALARPGAGRLAGGGALSAATRSRCGR